MYHVSVNLPPVEDSWKTRARGSAATRRRAQQQPAYPSCPASAWLRLTALPLRLCLACLAWSGLGLVRLLRVAAFRRSVLHTTTRAERELKSGARAPPRWAEVTCYSGPARSGAERSGATRRDATRRDAVRQTTTSIAASGGDDVAPGRAYTRRKHIYICVYMCYLRTTCIQGVPRIDRHFRSRLSRYFFIDWQVSNKSLLVPYKELVA